VWFIILGVAATVGCVGALLLSLMWGLVSVTDIMGANLASVLLSALVGSFAFTVVAVANHILKRRGSQGLSSYERRLFRERLKRGLEQPRRDELHDQLKFVYRPLYAAVLEMKGGKDGLPRAGTVGTPINPWASNRKIIDQVVGVFTHHSALIEDEEVLKGWDENKDFLRKGEFCYGKRQREWLMSIERRYTLIKWWLSSP
jgi:hypothetical protein